MIYKYFKIVFLLVVLDQITKSFIVAHYEFEQRVSLYRFFHIFLVYNENTMMGRYDDPFASGDAFKFVYLGIFALLAMGCVWTLNKIKAIGDERIKTITLWGLACISATGLGNALDRLFRKEGVVDFMHFSHVDLVFNFADVFGYIGIFLSLGMSLYIFCNYKKYKTVKVF